MKSFRIGFLFVFLILLACDKKSNLGVVVNNSGLEIAWGKIDSLGSDTIIVYQYSNGGFSGYNFKQKFYVINGSGAEIITVNVLNDALTKISDTFNVEQGKQYEITINVSVKNPYYQGSFFGQSCETIVCSSPNSTSSKDIFVPNIQNISSLMLPGQSYPTQQISYYCPESLTINALNISLVE